LLGVPDVNGGWSQLTESRLVKADEKAGQKKGSVRKRGQNNLMRGQKKGSEQFDEGQ
jgi:hypothetical protein